MPPSPSPVLTSARDVLDPAHLRAALRINPADATLAAALRVGAAAAVVLALSAAVGRADLAAFASLGALVILYGRYEPYRRRASLLAGVAGVFVAAFALTASLTALGAPTVVVLGVVALVAGLATALCALVRTGPPGASIVVFAAAGGMVGPLTWSGVAERGTAFAVGAVIAWLVGMSGYLVRPSAPARLAVRRAADAVRRSLDAGPDRAPEAARTAAAAVARAREVLADDLSHRRTRDTARVLAAELAAVAEVLDADGLGDPVAARPGTVPPADTLPARRRLRDDVRATWHTAGWRLGGTRVVLASVVAGGATLAAGLSHPAWAQLGATATLQGASTHHAVVRALQRGGGTVLGALLAWPLLAAHLSFAATCVVVVALQVVTEIVVGRHYGLAMLTITPMALLMTSLGGTVDPGGIAASRALDTVIGAVLGVLAVVLVHPRRHAAG
ncbi:FUSC family protein [Krasilnikoviella flava]|uniref:Fusaric acid resistance protein-like n=1 Tax=Krasilnikoviella flava TaxID=526729 RepID=A0A1T5JL88_9MICO|nr:FUSC family protein [Krasilnikoviella flava]SKC51998.1 Fusaric acid resistance protein-like [Krasilnikoviella flava]